MELLLIIVGGILSTAIIFMMVEWARGGVVDDEFNPFDQHIGDEQTRVDTEQARRGKD